MNGNGASPSGKKPSGVLPSLSDLIDDMRLKVRASYLILLENILELSKAPAPSVFSGIFSDVAEAVDSFEKCVAESETKYGENRAVLIEALKSLNAVNKYFHVTSSALVRESILTKAADAGKPGGSGSVLFSAHLESLLEGDNKINTNRLSAFISKIPLRMTTAVYYDYVRDAIKFLRDEPDAEIIEDYKRAFCPMRFLAENNFFSEMARELDALWGSFGQLSSDGVAGVNERLRELYKNFVATYDFLYSLFDSNNAAGVVARFGGEYGGGLFEDEAIRSLHSECVSAIRNRPSEDEITSLKNKIYAEQDDALNLARFDKPSDGAEIEIDDENRKPLADRAVLNKIYFETPLDYYAGTVIEDSDEREDAESLIESLTNFMRESEKELPPAKRRFLRQHFLSCLPYPYDFSAYKKYFIEIYDSLDDTNKNLMSYYVSAAMKPESDDDGKKDV